MMHEAEWERDPSLGSFQTKGFWKFGGQVSRPEAEGVTEREMTW